MNLSEQPSVVCRVCECVLERPDECRRIHQSPPRQGECDPCLLRASGRRRTRILNQLPCPSLGPGAREVPGCGQPPALESVELLARRQMHGLFAEEVDGFGLFGDDFFL